ncbi:MAG: DoxX family protein [Rhodobacteraceae bacterium]|nr:DoxX family protein [Paracoccaceae bacterium]
MNPIMFFFKVSKWYDCAVVLLNRFTEPWLIPSLARLVFAGVLFSYYWNSATTKIGDGPAGLFNLSVGAYVQMFPQVMEKIGYDISQLGFHFKIIALFGTWAEFVVPVLIVFGLFTRLAACGMIGFILVQSLVDIVGHQASAKTIGAWFDRFSDAVILDQRSFWILLLIILIIRGAGPVSLDAWFRFILKPERS